MNNFPLDFHGLFPTGMSKAEELRLFFMRALRCEKLPALISSFKTGVQRGQTIKVNNNLKKMLGKALYNDPDFEDTTIVNRFDAILSRYYPYISKQMTPKEYKNIKDYLATTKPKLPLFLQHLDYEGITAFLHQVIFCTDDMPEKLKTAIYKDYYFKNKDRVRLHTSNFISGLMPIFQEALKRKNKEDPIWDDVIAMLKGEKEIPPAPTTVVESTTVTESNNNTNNTYAAEEIVDDPSRGLYRMEGKTGYVQGYDPYANESLSPEDLNKVLAYTRYGGKRKTRKGRKGFKKSRKTRGSRKH